PMSSSHVRVDTGVEQGDEITPYYDPMIAKLIVWDENRERALARLSQALAQYRIVGVTSNVAFLSRLVRTPSFAHAALDTGLIEREQAQLWPASSSLPARALLIATLAELLDRPSASLQQPWQLGDGWRLNGQLQRSLCWR